MSFEIGEAVEIMPYKRYGRIIDITEGAHIEERNCKMCDDKRGRHILYRVEFGNQTSLFLETELIRWSDA